MKQNLSKNLHVKKKNISHAVAYSSTLRYIEDTLSNNTFYFHTYVVSIYPSELENKIPHGLRSASSVLYFFLLERDIDGNITTKFYDKRHDFNFPIVNFPY